MSQDAKGQPEGRFLCHRYLFHPLAQEDIASFLHWMDRETASSMLQLFHYSQASQQIRLITCVDRHHEAVALLTVYPALLSNLRSAYTLAAGAYSLAHLHLNTTQPWEVPDLAELLSCYMKYLVGELQASGFYWEIMRADLLFSAAAEKAGFSKVLQDERPYVLYTYAG